MNNTQIDNAKYIDVVMSAYNLNKLNIAIIIWKHSVSLWQYYRYGPNANIRWSESFKYEIKTTAETDAIGNTMNAEIALPLKYYCNFWRTLEIPLISCEINLILT